MVLALVIASAIFMEMLDSTVILTAMPHMARAFGTGPVAISLGVTAYMVAMAVSIPASGWAADRYGTRTVFIAAIATFVASSAACGLAQSLPQFVLMRVVQGLAAGMMSPVGRLAMLRLTARADLARAWNVLMMAGLFGAMSGPPVGGFVTTYLSWRWIFLLNVPVGLAGIVAVRRLFPELRGEHRAGFDWPGFALNGVALGGLLYGLQTLGEGSGTRVVSAVCALVGGVTAVFAVRHLRRASRPLISLEAFGVPSFANTCWSSFAFRLSIFGPMFVLPLLMQIGLGLSPFATGLFLLAHAAADMVAKTFAVQSLRRFGFRTLLIWTAFAYAGYVAGVALLPPGAPLAWLAALLAFGGMMRSLQMGAVQTLQVAEVPQAQMTGAATVSAVLFPVGQALGVALGALLLNLLLARHGTAVPSIADFRWTLAALVIPALLSLRWHLALHPRAGAEVSGHGRA